MARTTAVPRASAWSFMPIMFPGEARAGNAALREDE
jgi:hypothetical protein